MPPYSVRRGIAGSLDLLVGAADSRPYEQADATLFHIKNPHPMVGTGIFYYCTSLRQAEARAERVLHGIMRHRAAMVWTLLR